MSIESTTNREQFVVSALPQTTAINMPFQNPDPYDSDLAVYADLILLQQGSDYTISGGGYNAQQEMQGGSITIVSGGVNDVQVGAEITILRNVTPDQITTFASTGLQTPLMIEADDDKVTILGQQYQEVQGRSLRFQPGEILDGELLLEARKGKYLAFDSSTGAVVFLEGTTATTGVTSFSAGNLSPLFTTNVTSPNTNPALSFTLSNQTANRIFAGPATGAAAAPTFRQLVSADFPASLTFITPVFSGGWSQQAATDTYNSVGQDSTHYMVLGWTYDPTPALGFGLISTFGLNNRIYFQASDFVFDTLGKAAALYLKTGGLAQFSYYGAGTATFDSSGNVTSVSDERAKETIGEFTKGLSVIRKLSPNVFRWKPETGLNPDDVNVSVYAQDLIESGLEEAVFTHRNEPVFEEHKVCVDCVDKSGKKFVQEKIVKRQKTDESGKVVTRRVDGFYTVSDRPILAALINAVKELDSKISTIIPEVR